MSKAELRSAAKEYAKKALAKSEGRQPSQATVKKVADQIVKAFAPILSQKSGQHSAGRMGL